VVLLATAVVAGIVAAGVVGGSHPFSPGAAAATGPAPAGPEVGRPAPALAVPALAGGQLTLAQYAGRPRVIGFFAASCIDCLPDLAALEQVYRRYRRQGLVVLGIGVAATASDARGLARQAGATFPIGYDENGDLAVRAYRLITVPVTVFVSPAGTIMGIAQGRISDRVLAQYLGRILAAATR
jgi:peroxiredoxin